MNKVTLLMHLCFIGVTMGAIWDCETVRTTFNPALCGWRDDLCKRSCVSGEGDIVESKGIPCRYTPHKHIDRTETELCLFDEAPHVDVPHAHAPIVDVADVDDGPPQATVVLTVQEPKPQPYQVHRPYHHRQGGQYQLRGHGRGRKRE